MTVLVDTSALYALLDEDDRRHEAAAHYFRQAAPVLPHATHSYVLVETLALVQRRLGMRAVEQLVETIQPALDVLWVDQQWHERAVSRLAAARHRRLSLVDQVSFEVMRAQGIETAFAFDTDFSDQGFTTVP